MRNFTSTQTDSKKNRLLGVTLIDDVELDPNCRDEITKTLRGLQEIHREKPLLKKIKVALNKLIPQDVSWADGRKGMDIWVIFILGTLRLICNWDYDKLKCCYDNHRKIREIAGVDLFCDVDSVVGRQTIHDNVSLFTTEIANEINTIVVNFGHEHLFQKNEPLHARCDSFVLETNVHFPTDYNLLRDSVRKVLNIGSCLAKIFSIPGWREVKSQVNKFRNLYNRLSKMRESNAQCPIKKQKRQLEIKDTVSNYLEVAQTHLNKAEALRNLINIQSPELDKYVNHTRLLIDQISRRILNDETIPAEEKIYSIFEPHTEWICKGKAGVRQELGVKVCIIEDQFGFILNHEVMNKKQDNEIAVKIVSETQELFPELKSVSFDKGFYSALDKKGENNQSALEALNIIPYLPVKGYRNKKVKERESSQQFIDARKQHPAVESAINALESHGLDRCLDKGPERFDRYVAMAVCASNIHRIGAIKMDRELRAKRNNKRSA